MKYYILRTGLILLIAVPLYLIVRRPWRFKNKREIAIGLFVIYLICLFAFTLDGAYNTPINMLKTGIERIQTRERINIVPFLSIIRYLKDSSTEAMIINVISNVGIFIPWGFFLPVLWDKLRNWKILTYMCLGLTVFIEIFQLFIWRNTDIDDIILNFLGGMIGVALFFALQKLILNKK